VIRVAGSVMVVVKPGAKAPGIVTGDGGVIVVRVRERAVDGKANEAVRASLALALDVPKSAVALVRGATARLKAFSVDGLTDEQIRVRLAQVKK
jgi:uncharacterized protein YggU (UPF0235/DUF167 family)